MLKKIKFHYILGVCLLCLALPAGVTAKSYLIVVSELTYKHAGYEHSYNSLVINAAQKIETTFNARVEIAGLNMETPQALLALLQQNYDLVITVGNTMGLEARKIAKDFPAQNFALIDFSDGGLPPNACAYQFDGAEGAFLAGCLAARTTSVSRLGFIGGQVFPQVQKMGNAFSQGARYITPYIAITNVYINDFFDIENGREVAAELYNDGVEIIFHAAGLSGHGVVEAAKNADKWVIGVDADQYPLAPQNVLTSVIIDLEKAIMDIAAIVENDDFPAGRRIIMNLANGGVRLGDTYNIAPEILEELEAIEADIMDGVVIINKTLY